MVRQAAPQVGSPAQQAPAAADRAAEVRAAEADRAAAGTGLEMAAAMAVEMGVEMAAAGIEVMFPRGHGFAAQDSILTRPFA